MNNPATKVGIVAAAYQLPSQRRMLLDVFRGEGLELTADTAARLGIEEVRVCTGESGSELALAAARQAIQLAGIEPSAIDVIVDYSILPQEYLVPAWNMSNKLQHELDAARAFTLGFSGGGATNFLVALNFASALIQSDESIHTALLVGADVAIPANRVLNADLPVTVLGDGASAIILQEGVTHNIILDTELMSNGEFHDVCYIPGGALAQPDHPGLYRVQIDMKKYHNPGKMELLLRLTHNVLERAGLQLYDVSYFLYSNLSAEDQADFTHTFGIREDQLCPSNRKWYGHIQGSDFVLNYLSLLEGETLREHEYILICSHGMGFLSGVTLIRY